MRSRFSAELRRLRGDRGLSLAQLSALTHYSRGYLSNVENGRKPPTLDLARSLDEALGAGGALLSAVAVATAACPYRGLAAFGADDARWFFGREQLTAELVTAVAAGLDDGRPLAVFGVSGAGKSSLLHAGLLPAIARGALPIAGSAQWPVLSISPTNRPATALAAAVAKELGAAEPDVRDAIAQGCFGDKLRETLGPGDRRLVLLVDQFEEVFTTCESEAERAAFIEAICGASRFAGAHPSAVVVLGIRADFYGRCLTYPRLLAVVSGHQVAVAAMTGGQLVAAITAPAALARLTIEPGLVELLLRDLGIDDRGTADRYEPGALPLLSHALMATWQHRDGDRLTVAGYQATGGIHGAVAATAERTFTQLDEAARAAGRGLL
ncbi:helix-turn-helix domain-containing protein, partial [Nonomuraea sp. NPDC055795]